MGQTPELDGIRGWACASVLIAHCLTGIHGLPAESWVGWFNTHTIWLFLNGVDLFFVLSGFLVGGILIDTKGKAGFFSKFWIRRIARIFPIAYLMIATYMVAIYICDRFDIASLRLWVLAEPRPPVVSFLTFTQSWWFATGGFNGPRWLAMTWSLAIEEQFYVLFPLAVYFLPRKWLIAVVLGGIVAAPILRDVIERLMGSWYAAYVLLPSRMDAILYGVGVALIVRSPSAFAYAVRCRRVLDCIGLLILASIVGNWSFPLWPGPSGVIFPLKQSFAAILCAIIILRVFTYQNSFFNRLWLSKRLGQIGLISYALYMFHQSVNGTVHAVVFNQEPKIATLAHLIAAFCIISISIGLAILSHIYIEKPIRTWASRLSDNLPSAERVRQAPAV
jgi:peptidoglycan/LPS O-acetylase OafA/YrhL